MTDAATRAALDAATAALRATPAERRAVRAHQALSEHGSRINELLRGIPLPVAEGIGAFRVTQTLDRLLHRAELPRDLVLYHGVGDATDLPALDDLPAVWSRSGFLSTSLSPAVAAELATSGVVLRLLAQRRSAGLWLPPLGYRRLAYEEEVLLPRGSFLTLLAWHRVGGVVEIYSEVM